MVRYYPDRICCHNETRTLCQADEFRSERRSILVAHGMVQVCTNPYCTKPVRAGTDGSAFLISGRLFVISGKGGLTGKYHGRRFVANNLKGKRTNGE